MIFLSCVQYNLYFLKLQRFYLLNLYNYRCAKLVNFHNKISISKHRNTISWQWIVKRKLSVITFLCLCFKYLRFLQKSMFIHDQFILFFLWNTDTIIRAVNRRKVYNKQKVISLCRRFSYQTENTSVCIVCIDPLKSVRIVVPCIQCRILCIHM